MFDEEKYNLAKDAMRKLFVQLLERGISVVMGGAEYHTEKDIYLIVVTIDVAEESKNHRLPSEFDGFTVLYDYGNVIFPQK